METLDDIDRKLLALLRRNARTPASDLARRAGVARSTAQARIERMERMGVIRGYTVRTDPHAAEMIRAYVLIQVEPRRAAAVAAALERMPEIESLHTTSGRFDMAAQVAGRTTALLDRALDRIGLVEGVRGMETLVQLSTKVDRRA
ncbi:Lrp/AsnC family transcriptional regulator [Oceanicella actignis]|uniref:DNA-binding transcriptional regulator, Lrp family n=1 Tax=Oceanicella actignis TaxID=1189325 RepID=A0A1M7SCM8_9RHOB|nr:Lrp/AsnC family transcriptional regulator [Oceanicella actignis]TYO91471.1 DNA-binding Lrp family transcriptional regulator [Oceanicella actignis]SET26085.1 transcriptional regulator, AsnC family [Oceanicella actignis]SHN56230.1 DNA-binding transcriptional regulator, Lrp family [Oceanicella actignis]